MNDVSQFVPFRWRSLLAQVAFALIAVASFSAAAVSENRYHAARLSITANELHTHVATLADDTFEGRQAGSRGGRAAANYIAQQLSRYELTPAGMDGSYFQPCNRGYRNILALREGSDPQLKDEVVLVCAHYDHVGYGTPQTSFGPIGYIHNGADDNASGVSALLETIEALDAGMIETRRSLMFAFWDGEEIGLIGSQHWVSHPTIPLGRIGLMLNVDMIGWLRDGRLEIGGTRSGYGLRRLLTGALEQPLWLDFSWELEANSDHWPFFQRQIPVALIHTGLHDHYHRPTDDVERINHEGLQLVSRYMLDVLVNAANVDELPKFRSQARRENPATQRVHQRPAPPSPPRIGISWRVIPNGEAEEVDASPRAPGVVITNVVSNSAAAASGLRPGDHIVAYNGLPLVDATAFHQTLLRAASPVTLTVERLAADSVTRRSGEPTEQAGSNIARPLKIEVQPSGPPVRLGISWRFDDAEPESVFVTKVVSGSPADLAGIQYLDRILEVDRQPFSGHDEFSTLLRARLGAAPSQLELLVESRGHMREQVVALTSPRVAVHTE